MWGDKNLDLERYDRAVEMFLTEYLNGDVRKGHRQVDGYKAHTRRSTKKTIQEIVPLSSNDESGAGNVEVNACWSFPHWNFFIWYFKQQF